VVNQLEGRIELAPDALDCDEGPAQKQQVRRKLQRYRDIVANASCSSALIENSPSVMPP